MKKKSILFILIALLAVLSIAAAVGQERTGEQINILFAEPEMTFHANTPFYVDHGFLWWFYLGQDVANEIRSPAKTYFTLDVDGVEQHFSFFDRNVNLVEDTDGTIYHEYSHMWVFNFPGGMEGDHTFTGKWWAPCKYIQPECEKPNQTVVWQQIETLIHFETP